MADGGDVPGARLPLPRHASQAVAKLAGPERVTTTLDGPSQVALERLASDQLRRLPGASPAFCSFPAETDEQSFADSSPHGEQVLR
jgi:hypothetical protein